MSLDQAQEATRLALARLVAAYTHYHAICMDDDAPEGAFETAADVLGDAEVAHTYAMLALWEATDVEQAMTERETAMVQ